MLATAAMGDLTGYHPKVILSGSEAAVKNRARHFLQISSKFSSELRLSVNTEAVMP